MTNLDDLLVLGHDSLEQALDLNTGERSSGDRVDMEERGRHSDRSNDTTTSTLDSRHDTYSIDLTRNIQTQY
jgi:hypothetical protein